MIPEHLQGFIPKDGPEHDVWVQIYKCGRSFAEFSDALLALQEAYDRMFEIGNRVHLEVDEMNRLHKLVV